MRWPDYERLVSHDSGSTLETSDNDLLAQVQVRMLVCKSRCTSNRLPCSTINADLTADSNLVFTDVREDKNERMREEGEKDVPPTNRRLNY